MKNKLPAGWMIQFAAIIILFSIGTALFPTGLLVDANRAIRHFTSEPTYSYRGEFTANLTATTPNVNLSVGVCDTIEIFDNRPSTSPTVTARVINSTNAIVATFSSFGGIISPYPTLVCLDFLTQPQNYTIQFERETQDTMFNCHISAYVGQAAVMPAPPSFYSYWILGLILDIFGAILAINFIKSTKEYWLTS